MIPTAPPIVLQSDTVSQGDQNLECQIELVRVSVINSWNGFCPKYKICFIYSLEQKEKDYIRGMVSYLCAFTGASSHHVLIISVFNFLETNIFNRTPVKNARSASLARTLFPILQLTDPSIRPPPPLQRRPPRQRRLFSPPLSPSLPQYNTWTTVSDATCTRYLIALTTLEWWAKHMQHANKGTVIADAKAITDESKGKVRCRMKRGLTAGAESE